MKEGQIEVTAHPLTAYVAYVFVKHEPYTVSSVISDPFWLVFRMVTVTPLNAASDEDQADSAVDAPCLGERGPCFCQRSSQRDQSRVILRLTKMQVDGMFPPMIVNS